MLKIILLNDNKLRLNRIMCWIFIYKKVLGNVPVSFLRKYFVNITALLPNVILFFTLFKNCTFLVMVGSSGMVYGTWNLQRVVLNEVNV